MPRDVVVLFGQDEGRKLIAKHCRRIGLPVADLRRMVEEKVDNNTMQRRRRLWSAFEEILDTQDDGGRPLIMAADIFE